MNLRPILAAILGIVAAAAAACDDAKDRPRLGAAAARELRAHVQEATRRIRAARITQDHGEYRAAQDAVDRALALDPNDPSARTVLAVVQAGRHQFTQALATARAAAAANPTILMNHAIETDALVELGRYGEAVDAAQSMVDRKPCAASLARASYLRTLHGDHDGAIALMTEAREAHTDAGEKGWCSLQIALEELARGDGAAALRRCEEALALRPDLHAASLALARIHAGLGDAARAESLLSEMLANGGPDPDAEAQLGELLLAAGRGAEAKPHLSRAEALERAELAAGGNEVHHLVDLLLLQDGRETECLELAEREAQEKRDLFTCDRLGLARLKSAALLAEPERARRLAEALAASRDALRTGTDDPNLLANAALVHLAAGDAERGKDLMRRALSRKVALRPMTLRRVS